MADLGHFPAAVAGMAQLCKIIPGNGPPCLQGIAVGGQVLVESQIGVQDGLDGWLGVDYRAKGKVPRAFGLKQRGGFNIEFGKVGLLGLDLGLGYAADEVGLHVFRLRIRGVVYVAADVEVVIVTLDDFGLVDQAAVLGYLPFVGKDEIDFLDVFGAQFVLGFAFGVFAVGVDEQHLIA